MEPQSQNHKFKKLLLNLINQRKEEKSEGKTIKKRECCRKPNLKLNFDNLNSKWEMIISIVSSINSNQTSQNNG